MKKSLPAQRLTSKNAAKLAPKISTKLAKSVAKVAVKPPLRSATASRRSATVRVSSASESIWTKKFLHEEQEEFHAAHPNAKVLIGIFMGTVALFVYLVWVNRVDLFPQLFVM